MAAVITGINKGHSCMSPGPRSKQHKVIFTATLVRWPVCLIPKEGVYLKGKAVKMNLRAQQFLSGLL